MASIRGSAPADTPGEPEPVPELVRTGWRRRMYKLDDVLRFWKLTDDTVSFDGCAGPASHVLIPERVAIDGVVHTVVDVYKCAFEKNTSVESVVLPNTIKSIGDQAFKGCARLELRKLPDSLECIGDEAFWDARRLCLTELPAGLRRIGKDAFWHCEMVKISSIPHGCSYGSYGSSTLDFIRETYGEHARSVGGNYFNRMDNLCKIFESRSRRFGGRL